MEMFIRSVIIAFMLMLTLQTVAQKRKGNRAPQPTPEMIQKQERTQRMISNTERIMFIDSIVVEKEAFLNAYNLNPEMGSIDTYQHHFGQKRQPNGYVYVNELGNKCLLSQENNEGIINLYSSERVNNKWTRPTKLRGINDSGQYLRANFPFMMGDGQTLYFAAEGEDGLGGYDIYMTTYDAESDSYLSPVNIGMPFNSEANDYMYVIDEYDSLGWFATDRNQPEGKVCVYTFLPSENRRTYSPEEFTSEEIAAFARLESIMATWDDKTKLDQALTRMQRAALRKRQKVTGREFRFVINDDVTYYHLSDFKAPDNARRYQQLMSIQLRYRALSNKLDAVRDYYITAGKEEREELKEEILVSEKKQLELYRDINVLRKDIRNRENIFLTNK